MMNSQQGSLRVARGWVVAPLVTAVFLAVMFGLSGCSDQSVNVAPSQDQISFFDLSFDDEAFAKRTTSYDAYYWCFQDLSAEEGGTIEVPGSSGAFSFVVAPNSFPADTLFDIKVYVLSGDDGAPVVIYEFAPDGLVFSEPAKLIVNTEVVGGQSVDYYYLSGTKWLYQGTYSAQDGAKEIVIDVPHFSKWGTEGPTR